MAKKQNKAVKEETLETILFNCRNSLRGRAAMTDKRDLLLTLVFLKFIGERFKQQKEKIRHEIVEVQGIHDVGLAFVFVCQIAVFVETGRQHGGQRIGRCVFPDR